MKKQLLLILSIYMGWTMMLSAQDGMSGYFMHNTLQRGHFNPAFYDSTKVNVSIAQFSANIWSTSENIFANTTTNDQGTTIIDINALERKDVDNYGFFDIGTIELSLNLANGWNLNAGHRIEGFFYNGITEDLINLAIDGNAPYIGETLNLDPDITSMAYHQLYLGASKRLGKLDVGARLSYLSGIVGIQTEDAQMSLTTDDEYYQLKFDNNYRVNSSGIFIYNGLDDIESDYENPGFGANSGFGLDLGLSYHMTDKMTLSASVIDLGSISWTDKPQNFVSSGQFQYDGIDISDYINEDVEIELTDSLNNLLQIEETNEDYSTSLPTRYLIGADYMLNQKWRLGGLMSYRSVNNASYLSLAVNATGKVFSFLDLGLTYSYRPNNPFNLGLSTVWNLGPIQLLLATDNVLAGNVSESTHAHLRGGLSIRI